MTFRTKLLVVSSLTVAGAVALVTGVVSISARRAFERVADERRKGVRAQFDREMETLGREVENRVQRAAAADSVLRIAIEANRTPPDYSAFLGEARAQADAQALDFLDILEQDGAIISSAHRPARFGFRNDWLLSAEDFSGGRWFLTGIPQADEGSLVAVAAVRSVSAGDKSILVVGARRLDTSFLASLSVAPGMRALLWLASGEFMDQKGSVAGPPEKLVALIERAERTRRETAGTVAWTSDRADSESIVALPLEHGGNLLGALLVGTSLREQVWLRAGVVRDPAGLEELAGSPDPVAALVARFAIARAESRGVHYRIDAPTTDPVLEGHFVLRPGRGLSLEQWT